MSPTLTLPMTAGQYTSARAALMVNPQVIGHVEITPESGSFATAQVSMLYTYAAGTMTIHILSKSGLARFASLDTIKSHLQSLLTEIS